VEIAKQQMSECGYVVSPARIHQFISRSTCSEDTVKLKPFYTVRVVGSRSTAKVRAILVHVHGATLEKPCAFHRLSFAYPYPPAAAFRANRTCWAYMNRGNTPPRTPRLGARVIRTVSTRDEENCPAADLNRFSTVVAPLVGA